MATFIQPVVMSKAAATEKKPQVVSNTEDRRENSDPADTLDPDSNSSVADNDGSILPLNDERGKESKHNELAENGTVMADATESSQEEEEPVPYTLYKRLLEERDSLTQELQRLKEQEESFQDIAKRFESKCLTQQEELDTMEENMRKQSEKTDSLQQELNKKLAELGQAVQNEETVMVRLASLEQERMKLLDGHVSLERKTKELAKELEKSQSLVKSQKAELTKLKTTNEKQESLMAEQNRELPKLKEEVSSLGIKLKWAQNKLKAETETHKDTKNQLSVTTKKLQQAKEESEQIRQDLKKMIAQYQESEEMKSSTLDVKLRKTEEELRQQEQEIMDQQQLLELTVKDLELNQASLEISQKECQQLKTRVSELTNQITEKQDELDKAKQENVREKKEQKRLLNEIAAIQDMNKDIEKERQDNAALKESHAHLQKTNQHLERELGRRKDKEAELLAFSEKLSSSNAQLTTEKELLEGQVKTLEEDLITLRTTRDKCQHQITELEESLKLLRQSSQKEITSLMQSLQDKSKAVEQLSVSLEEEREQILALKRKHANNIKDMQRQVQLYSKRIEQLEASNHSDVATLPLSNSSSPLGVKSTSQGSLHGSLNNIHVTLPHANRMPSPDDGLMSPPNVQIGNSTAQQLFETLDPEKTVLVEKMCQLKRLLAKKDEKLEFYETHSQQLTEDIKKKARVIQHFIMREESGALIPPEVDANRAQISRKSGIMASVFSGSSQKPSSEMTLQLSLEINHKMQAVLEDTLLKNITLKESLNTLGQEVARLSSQLQVLQKPSNSPLR